MKVQAWLIEKWWPPCGDGDGGGGDGAILYMVTTVSLYSVVTMYVDYC